MEAREKEIIIYGIKKRNEIIDRIIEDIKAYDYSFDIRLILTEALINAYKHGNKSEADKPIYLRYSYDDNKVRFEIEDSGNGFRNVTIPDQVSDEKILDDNGRGLFLIKSISDRIEIRENTLIIQKYLSKKRKEGYS